MIFFFCICVGGESHTFWIRALYVIFAKRELAGVLICCHSHVIKIITGSHELTA